MQVLLLSFAMIIWGKQPGKKLVILRLSKTYFGRDPDVSNGDAGWLGGVVGDKSDTTRDCGGPESQLQNAWFLQLNQWKSGCNTNWYNQLIHDILPSVFSILSLAQTTLLWNEIPQKSFGIFFP